MELTRAATAFHGDLLCRDEGATLATIGNAAESAAVAQIVVDSGALVMPFIGLYFDVFAQSFTWADGNSYLFVNWGQVPSLQPRSTCVAVNADATGSWRTVSCDDRRPYVCERAPHRRSSYTRVGDDSSSATVADFGAVVVSATGVETLDGCLSFCDATSGCVIAVYGGDGVCTGGDGTAQTFTPGSASFSVYRQGSQLPLDTTMAPTTTVVTTTSTSTDTVSTSPMPVSYTLTYTGASLVNGVPMTGSRFDNIFVAADRIKVLSDSTQASCEAECTAEVTCRG